MSVRLEIMAFWGWDRLTPNRMLLSTLRECLGWSWTQPWRLSKDSISLHIPQEVTPSRSMQRQSASKFILPLLPGPAYPGKTSILVRATSWEIYSSARQPYAVQSLHKRWAQSQRWVLIRAPAHAMLPCQRFKWASQSNCADISRCHGP